MPVIAFNAGLQVVFPQNETFACAHLTQFATCAVHTQQAKQLLHIPAPSSKAVTEAASLHSALAVGQCAGSACTSSSEERGRQQRRALKDCS